MIFFSIIIPVYNSEVTISKCLDSIVSQTFQDYEVLVMDGLSKDNTANLVKDYENKKVKLFSGQDTGIYDAMNKGITKAEGEWLYFLGSDDYLYDNNVLREVADKLSEGAIDLLYGNAYFPIRKKIYDGEFTIEKLLLHRRNICHQAIFYSKKLFDLFGLFNTQYRILADYDFNLKIFLEKRFTIQFINRTIAVFYDGASSKTIRDLDFEKDLVQNYVLKEYSAYDIYTRMISKSRALDSIHSINEQRTALSYLKAVVKKIKQGQLW